MFLDCRKKIQSIVLGDFCEQSAPCVHTLTVTYTDGSTKEEYLDALEIMRKGYFPYLTAENVTHLDQYRDWLLRENRERDRARSTWCCGLYALLFKAPVEGNISSDSPTQAHRENAAEELSQLSI